MYIFVCVIRTMPQKNLQSASSGSETICSVVSARLRNPHSHVECLLWPGPFDFIFFSYICIILVSASVLPHSVCALLPQLLQLHLQNTFAMKAEVEYQRRAQSALLIVCRPAIPMPRCRYEAAGGLIDTDTQIQIHMPAQRQTQQNI